MTDRQPFFFCLPCSEIQFEPAHLKTNRRWYMHRDCDTVNGAVIRAARQTLFVAGEVRDEKDGGAFSTT